MTTSLALSFALSAGLLGATEVIFAPGLPASRPTPSQPALALAFRGGWSPALNLRVATLTTPMATGSLVGPTEATHLPTFASWLLRHATVGRFEASILSMARSNS